MANNPTPPAITVGAAWVDLYAASGISVGTGVLVTCRGQQSAFIAESATQPDDSLEGIEAYPTRQLIVDTDSAGLWAKTSKANTTTKLIVQVDTQI